MRCVRDSAAPAFQVLYAYPIDRDRRLGSGIAKIHAAIRLANGIIDRSAKRTSPRWDVRMRVRCDAKGRIKVRAYAMSKAGDDGRGETFRQIVTAGRAAGFRSELSKYVVFWDSPISGMCGQAQMAVDDRRIVANNNNKGDQYAVLYGRSCWTGALALHEIGHTMGAVQNSAPHSTRSSHCYQELDIMCYADGGPSGRTSSLVRACARVVHFDCRHDDYFHVGATSGYLATHWNVGWTANRFLSFVVR